MLNYFHFITNSTSAGEKTESRLVNACVCSRYRSQQKSNCAKCGESTMDMSKKRVRYHNIIDVFCQLILLQTSGCIFFNYLQSWNIEHICWLLRLLSQWFTSPQDPSSSSSAVAWVRLVVGCTRPVPDWRSSLSEVRAASLSRRSSVTGDSRCCAGR